MASVFSPIIRKCAGHNAWIRTIIHTANTQMSLSDHKAQYWPLRRRVCFFAVMLIVIVVIVSLAVIPRYIHNIHLHHTASAIAPISVITARNGLMITGTVKDHLTQRALLDAILTGREDVNVTDHLQINPYAPDADFTQAASLFELTDSVRNFSLTLDQNIVSVSGMIASRAQMITIETIIKTLWPHKRLENHLTYPSS